METGGKQIGLRDKDNYSGSTGGVYLLIHGIAMYAN